jgi:alpha-ketoglutarate-dependent taurine dioxygenase
MTNHRRHQVEPLDATFGAVVTGVRLRELDDDGFDELYRLWLEHALLIFPGQHLSRDEQDAFARRFGALEFETSPISNVRGDGSVRRDDGSDWWTMPAGRRASTSTRGRRARRWCGTTAACSTRPGRGTCASRG